MIFDQFDETSRGFTGEYGQLNVYDEKLKKYVLLVPVETLPSVVGSTNTVEHDTTTSRVVGKIKAKMTIEDKDCTFLLCRDNLVRLMEFTNRPAKFLVSYKDGTGWKFSGTISIKPDDVSASDKATGTFTIIANAVDQVPTLDVRDLMAKTCVITNEDLPTEIVITATGSSATYDIPVLVSDSKAQVEVESNNSAIKGNYSEGKVTITVTGSTATSGIIVLKPTVAGQASWKNHILVDVIASA